MPQHLQTRSAVLCFLTVEYLVVTPIANVKCNMKTSMQREWKETWRGLDVGHRGAGSSFKCEIKQYVSFCNVGLFQSLHFLDLKCEYNIVIVKQFIHFIRRSFNGHITQMYGRHRINKNGNEIILRRHKIRSKIQIGSNTSFASSTLVISY